MPYRVQQDGTIETDTPEEAVELSALLDRKKHGKRLDSDNGHEPVAAPKTSTRRRGKSKTRAAAQNGRRPQAAVDNGVRLGQVYQKHKGGNSGSRVIQIDKLLKDGIIPKVIKKAPDTTRSSITRKVSYTVLRRAYRLIKDV